MNRDFQFGRPDWAPCYTRGADCAHFFVVLTELLTREENLVGLMPPAYGLATAIVPAFVAALAGRSPTVITGPTNTTSLLLLGVVLPFLGPRGLAPDALQWVATLTLLCGLPRFVVAFGGGAVLIRFLPESVLAGFIVGAGILIGMMQLDEALGLPPIRAAGAWAEF